MQLTPAEMLAMAFISSGCEPSSVARHCTPTRLRRPTGRVRSGCCDWVEDWGGTMAAPAARRVDTPLLLRAYIVLGCSGPGAVWSKGAPTTD